MDDRAFASATQLANDIRDRRTGCVELLDFYLARAERHNPALNAIVVWQLEQARERARAADAALARGDRWGPLHGIPMTVKESFNVAGLPTTFGNPLWKDNIATGNAFLIDRLLQAGAILASAGGLAGRVAIGAAPPTRRVSRRGVGIFAAVPDRHQRI